MPGALQTQAFGPFTRGVVSTAEASVGLTGALRQAVGVEYTGAFKLATRQGTRVAMTLTNGAGQTCTAVWGPVQFGDGALAMGYYSGTAYLFRLNSTLTGWYDNTGALTVGTTANPVGTLWSGLSTAPDITIAEGLGVGYIAHADAASSGALSYATRTFTLPGTIADLTSNLDASGGNETLYFSGVVSFQQHLWGWGFGSGTTATTGYRPELARFSGAIFSTGASGLFSPSDSLTLGNRVRSEREKIIGAAVVGESLYLGSRAILTRVTGYGRNTWFKEMVAQSHGFAGPKCMVTVSGDNDDALYYWSAQGPTRMRAQGKPEALWPRVAEAVASAINVEKIVAGYDAATDQVVWAYDTGSGVRTRLAYDVRRDLFLGPDDDCGVTVFAMGAVAPVYASTATVSYAPSGAPSGASTTSVGATTATANWTAGDATASTRVESRIQGTADWTVVTTVGAGVASYTFTGLSASTAYEWRVAHDKGGSLSSYLGPSAATQFTTEASGSGAVLVAPSSFALANGRGTSSCSLRATWTNSGESGVSTEVYLAGPALSTPAADDYGLAATVAAGVASATFTVYEEGTYYAYCRHVDGAGGVSLASNVDTGVAVLMEPS